MNTNSRWVDRCMAGAFALSALVLYAATLSAGAYPGESAMYANLVAGLLPRLSPDHPLWHAVAWLVSRGPVEGLVWRLNILSVLCAAAAVYVFYGVVAEGVRMVMQPVPSSRPRMGLLSNLAAMAASMALITSIPFWVVGNRVHPAAFDVLLLLLILRAFLRYLSSGEDLVACAMALACGLVVAEFATMWVFVPVLAFGVFWALHRFEKMSTRRVLTILASGLVGLGVYLIAAWFFYGSDGYAMRGYTGYWNVVVQMWRDQLMLIAHSLPRTGWLVVLFVTAVPWLAMLMVAPRALNGERDWALTVLHAVMTAVVIAVVLNARLAPWAMLDMGRILVTPYILTASVFGYLVAYWFVSLSGDAEVENPFVRRLRGILGPLVAVAAVGTVVVAAVRNAPQADARASGAVNRFAHNVVSAMEGRTWLITDGVFDHHLRLAAAERGTPLRVLNTRAGNNAPYLKYMASLFDDVRLRNMAGIGLQPLLREWFASDSKITDKVAVMVLPDLWALGGYVAVPNRLVFLGTSPKAAVLEELSATDKAFWDREMVAMKVAAERAGRLQPLAQAALRQASLVANNLGVYLEDQDKPVEAFAAYAQARAILPQNLSALLNQYGMVLRGHETPDAASIKEETDKVGAGLKRKLNIWSLSQYYGYVRLPEAFAELGWLWALSGQPGMAVRELERAVGMTANDSASRTALKRVLAGLLAVDEPEEGEALYIEILAEKPEDPGALLGLARLSAKKGDLDKALSFLDDAGRAGVRAERLQLERARFLLGAGKGTEAEGILRELTESRPEIAPAWDLLMAALIQRDDREELTKCLRRLEERGQKGSRMASALGKLHLAMAREDRVEIRRTLESMLPLVPNRMGILEMLLQLDVRERRTEEAGRHARELLSLDPRQSLANYVLGSLQIDRGEYVLAEDSMRRSLEGRRTPEACNDLAWLLQRRAAYDEAEPLARESLKLNGKVAPSWDTLGVILLRQGRVAEAEQAMEKAISLYPNVSTFLVHMAEVQLRKGDFKKVKDLVAMLVEKQDQLSFEDELKLTEIRRAIERR